MSTKETSHPLLSATKHDEFRVPGPGTAGLVDNPADWPFSSFRRCVIRGFIRRIGSVAAPSRPRPETPVIEASECAALFRPTLAFDPNIYSSSEMMVK